MPSDFDALEAAGVDVRGKIALTRYGGCFRGLKAMNAEARGAVATLIYSDPQQDGFSWGPTYPAGPWRPPQGVQRGSAQYLSLCAGDPFRLYLDADAPDPCGNVSYVPKHPVLPLSYEDALPIQEAEMSTMRRLGAREEVMLAVQGNLASTYKELGRIEECLNLYRDVYSQELKLFGRHNRQSLESANNYASTLKVLNRHDEVKTLMRKTLPVARRVLGDSNALTLRMRWIYAQSLCRADGVTLDDVREAVTTLEDSERIARRVLGGAHPLTVDIEGDLRKARDVRDARESGRGVIFE